MDFGVMCRTCLRSDGIMCSLFDCHASEVESPTSTLLRIITNIQISANDGFPDQICNECSDEIIRAHAFKLNCEKSQIILKQLKQQEIDLQKFKEIPLSRNNRNKGNSLSQNEVAYPNISQESIICIKEESADDYFESVKYTNCTKTENLQERETQNIQCKNNSEIVFEIEKLVSPNISHLKSTCIGNEMIVDSQEVMSKQSPDDSAEDYEIEVILQDDDEQQSFMVVEIKEDYVDSFNEKPISSTENGLLNIDTEQEVELELIEECEELQSPSIKAMELDTAIDEEINFVGMPSNEKISDNSDNIILECPGCDYTNESLPMAKKHFFDIHVTNGFCELCMYNITRQKRHCTKHIIRYNNLHVCYICNKYFNFKIDLKRHTSHAHRIHISPSAKTEFTCAFCLIVFPHKELLEYHRKITHPPKNGFQCYECSKQFKSEVELFSHLNVHALENQFQCYICPKSFRTKSDLHLHECEIQYAEKWTNFHQNSKEGRKDVYKLIYNN